MSFHYVFLGLSITSSWGNGHATTYRALLRQLAARGHRITFLERDLPFYAENRDLPSPSFATTHLYGTLEELRDRFARTIASADLVVVGSYVPDGIEVGAWVQRLAPGRCAFYDIDTPVTLARLEASGDAGYLEASQIPGYSLYLSFTGGPTLDVLRDRYGSPRALPLYCSVDAEAYRPELLEMRWDLGYLGTYSDDRQPALDRLLVAPAEQWPEGRFAVVGPQYPDDLRWPTNVDRTVHLPPAEHRGFYCAQRYTLNVTRAAMVQAGYSPSVRLFEAAACGTPIISDRWAGLESVLTPGKEILVADTTSDVLRFVRDLAESERRRIGEAARSRILAEHTSAHRAETLERYTADLLSERAAATRTPTARAASSTMRGTT
ncbi:MAG: glycosyltransferase [Labilithrix sp.]|nr:glycosyltransferase [Labilithrix sp.]